MPRNLIVGDIHASYGKLMDALDKAALAEDDRLFCTGDLVDRGDEPVETLRFLMGLKNFFPVLGNHDVWLQNYAYDEGVDPTWLMEGNGGWNTLTKIAEGGMDRDELLCLAIWMQKIPYMRVIDSHLIVHAGFGRESSDLSFYKAIGRTERKLPDNMMLEVPFQGKKVVVDLIPYLWDRHFLKHHRLENQGCSSDDLGLRVFVGHTPVLEPEILDDGKLIAVDTGGFLQGGAITVMDMDTLEYWESWRTKPFKVPTGGWNGKS